MLRWFQQSARVKQVGPYCRFNLPAVCHQGKKGPEKPWTRPDPGEIFPKFSLSPYATAQGSPFYLQQAAKEKELLSTCLRICLALSESAGTVEMGAQAMAGYSRDDPAAMKQGFRQLAEFFASSDGKDSLPRQPH